MSDGHQLPADGTVTHADIVLGGLPVAFATTYGVGVIVLGVHLQAVGLAALVCLSVMIDALVFHPPFG
jgi:hypothetical protein